jgi:hypothetical protein
MLLYFHHSRIPAFALPRATPLASPAHIANFPDPHWKPHTGTPERVFAAVRVTNAFRSRENGAHARREKVTTDVFRRGASSEPTPMASRNARAGSPPRPPPQIPAR